MVWFFKKTKQIETKALTVSSSPALANFLLFGEPGSAQTPSSALKLYEDSTAVSVPINMVADSFSTLVLVLEDKETGEKITDSPLLDLLNTPSPHYTGCLFKEIIAKDFLITGETEIIAIGNTSRPPIQLEPINPKNVTISPNSERLIGSFSVSGSHLDGVYVLDISNTVNYFSGGMKELKQIRNYSTKDDSLLRGQSPLVSASKEARQHILGGKHNVALLNNGGRPTLVYNIEEDMNNDDFSAAREKVENKFAGASNAGSIIVTAGGKSTVTELGNTNRDMDFTNLQAMARQAVALQYRVPLPLITTDASSFNNYQQAKLALYDDAVLPLAGKLLGGLEDFLFPRFNIDATKFKLTYDKDKINTLTMRRNEELIKRAALGVERVDEIRATLGLEPIGDDRGDKFVKNATPVTVTMQPAAESDEPIEEVDEDE